MPHRLSTRRGSILVIVAGLAALLLTMFLIVTRQVRVEVNEGVLVARETQARFMLPAALSFILEAGRLGSEFDGEAFGWTDVRDGGVGPRGARAADGSLPAEIAAGAWPGKGGVYRSPMRAWQRPPGAVKPLWTYNPLVWDPEWLKAYDSADDKTTTFLYRALNPAKVAGDMGDYATAERYTSYKGIGGVPTTKPVNDPLWWQAKDNTGTLLWPADFWMMKEDTLKFHWRAVMDLLLSPENVREGEEYDERFHFLLGPQPVADTIADHLTGELTSSGEPLYRMDSLGRAWFRLYRETETDHDGDGAPWYDTMRLEDPTRGIRNHGVFIVTCGAGATEGYKDWAEASTSGHFPDQAFFEELRAQERIMWFRVQWSPFTGGGVDFVNDRYRMAQGRSGAWDDDGNLIHPDWGGGSFIYLSNLLLQRDWNTGDEDTNQVYGRNHNKEPAVNSLGTISWIERLEREPPNW
jgi:hypothetical protein